jgi:tRNA pseudouridine38-40 synthase
VGRFFIEISYNGANYSGWQTQENASSVQETLQKVAIKVLKQEIEIVGSSRTDAGVHALYQVAQLDFEPTDSLAQIIFKLNMALPNDISVLDVYKVKHDTNARFEAISRSYRYVISRKKDPFWLGRSLYSYGTLDMDAMNQCTEIIKNTTDFQSFSKVKTKVNNFNCTIIEAKWSAKDHFLFFEITANRFLRGMVRGLVGTMLEVGKGKISVSDFRKILESKDRKKAGENAPACGLYLVKVDYPVDIRL